MNILILQSKAFPHRANSFCYFYTQLTEWLTAHGAASRLFFCYLRVDDSGFENGLHLPDDYEGFYTPRNIEAACTYIAEKRIDVILDYSHIITGDTRRFFLEIRRRNPQVKLFTMIHNCPKHTTQLKAYVLPKLKLKDAHGPKGLFQWMFPRLYLFLLKRVESYQNISAYNTMDEIVLLSPSYIPEFRRLIGKKDASRLSAIPNAIKPVESNIPIEQKKKEIIFVGRFDPEKGLPKLLKIWEMVQDELPEWNLIMVGDGGKYKECAQMIADKKLKRIQLTGHQMSIPYIDRASILCLTSVIEGLPTVFVEAMSLGVVPIGFDSFRAIYDMIDNGKNGIVIRNNDYKAYAKALIRLATDDTYRQQIAAAAKQQAGRYDIEHIGPLWLEAFRKHGIV